MQESVYQSVVRRVSAAFAAPHRQRAKENADDADDKKPDDKTPSSSTYENAAELSQHPVLRGIEPLQVLLRSAGHGEKEKEEPRVKAFGRREK